MIRKLIDSPTRASPSALPTVNRLRPSTRWRELRKLCRRRFRLPTVFFSIVGLIILVFLGFNVGLSAHERYHSYTGRDVHTTGSQPQKKSAGEFAENRSLAGQWDGPAVSQVAKSELQWNYLLKEKLAPYVGHAQWMSQLPVDSRHYFNSLAVVSGYDDHHAHGLLGMLPNGTNLWQPQPRPPPINDFPGGKDEALKHGGFYLALSDALPLSRAIPDLREKVCKAIAYNYTTLGDSTIIITFFNEPISTLMRTVHSVLNYSPPPLVREIILVDDHSDAEENKPGGPLYDHVNLLPKVKLMRLPERRGIVQARLAGAKVARGSNLVFLDSHIEVNPTWLEPQLARIAEVPEAIVFPQIFSLTHDTLEHKTNAGIGCWLTFRWVAVEQAMLTGKVSSAEAVASASMAGGLFAIDREWFWEFGGYDEGFVAWGAENVEMAFRAWMCGGRVECVPCSQTYHIYRKGGSGYSNPPGALWRNRKRTARVWMDEHYQLASPMIDLSAGHGSFEMGSIDTMLELKKRLKCKSFQWYLQNVDPNHDARDLHNVIALGRIRQNGLCVDLGGSRVVGHKAIVYSCHPPGKFSGNQGFLISRGDDRIRVMANDKRCLGVNKGILQIEHCNDAAKSSHWSFEETDEPSQYRIVWNSRGRECLSIINTNKLTLENCEAADPWYLDSFKIDPDFELPRVAERKRLRQRLAD
eukprot:Protomagalhaensia_sp_Gyna_25__6130@NODE_99_length_5285_cov_19_953298_g76_i0_p1_GENE_NODE_99_length_5285_cov_19_953298_g76_i0NODE_99_length_5285_cov_19_953298_g76_i0_p1_ORF_typecomplete_len696_score76_92Glycos_transf_2/PF00535_26/3_9e21Glyco_tranf_2_3/PF13641_6/3_4e20Glyco_transf_7C/PF02709_14/2_2e15Glyco_tranf_2_2/PF10111_9/1_4e14Ricin_B_lectin/PF00652_22/2e12CDtoxinA/PF03498_14/6_1e05DUF3683/PF12447_8/0_29Glyco_trans_2_3/PF13632_6/3_7e03Glyco_trans_2_3/PF13632_6/0_054_NODE_99_length_5285_cov_19